MVGNGRNSDTLESPMATPSHKPKVIISMVIRVLSNIENSLMNPFWLLKGLIAMGHLPTCSLEGFCIFKLISSYLYIAVLEKNECSSFVRHISRGKTVRLNRRNLCKYNSGILCGKNH
jgi:hypothetical protein